MRQSRPDEAMSDSPLKMKLAFYSWLGLLLITLGTFTAGLLGHFVTLIAAPWLSLGTQAAIHAAIPVLLTAVKFVTVPLLLVLVPFARRHPTFRSWTNWSKARFRQLEQILRIPWSLAKARFLQAISMFLRREGVKSGSPADEAEGKGEKSSAKKLLETLSNLLFSGGESQTRAMENARSRVADLARGLKTPLTVLIAEAARLRANGEPEIAPERSPIWRRCAKGASA